MSLTIPSRMAGCYYHISNDSIGYWHSIPMVECKAHTVIKGSCTRTRLKQYFNNVSQVDIEKCHYVFPLYDGVSVVGFKCQIGGRVIEGIVKEREEAKKEFEEAVAMGETAGLMEQSLAAADVFSTTLGNVPKDSTAIVTIEYTGELQHDLETDSLKFGMPTDDQNYGRAIEHNCTIHQLPDANGFEWICDIEMPDAITRVDSSTHAVSVSLGRLSDESENVDPDFKKCHAKMVLQKESGLAKELILTVKAKGIKDPVALWEVHPSIPSQSALMATLVPNFSLPQIKPEIVFVCDRSGSMAGDKITTLVDALRIMLHSLPDNGIKFNICSFGSDHSFLFKKSQSYSRETLNEAIKYLENFGADLGGTETQGALRATIENRYGDIPLEVVLLTDGDIWNQESLFTYLNEKVEESKEQIRVFPLGIGHGVSTALIEGVARAGNGFPSTVMPGERMDKRCMRMLKAALSPHISNYKLEVQYERNEHDSDDFVMVESVEDATEFVIRSRSPGQKQSQSATGSSSAEPKTISLFDKTADADDTEMASSAPKVPNLHPPKIMQAPFKIPQLFAFKRTTVYLFLGPASADRKPSLVILRGTLDGTELKIEIPILDIGKSRTIHQLAARRAAQDLEEGRGWVFEAKADDGRSIKEANPSQWDDVVKAEAVRIGTTFQVMNRWCSYVARERKAINKNDNDDQRDESSSRTLRSASSTTPSAEDDLLFFGEFDSASSSAPVTWDPPDSWSMKDVHSINTFGATARNRRHSSRLQMQPAMMQQQQQQQQQAAMAPLQSMRPMQKLQQPAMAPLLSKGVRTKPTARTSTGGMAPRKQLASCAARMAVPSVALRHRKVLPDPPGTSVGGPVTRSRAMSSTSDHEQIDSSDEDDEDEEMEDAPAPAPPPAPAPLPRYADDAARVSAVIKLQEFDGSWETSGNGGENLKLLAHILGVEQSALEKSIGSKSAERDAAVWITVCVMAWLEDKMADERDIWEMSFDKAQAWLQGRKIGKKDMESAKQNAMKLLN